MKEIRPEILTAIASTINGYPTDEEKHLVDNWLLENENNQKLYANLRLIGFNGNLEKGYLLKEKVFGLVNEKIKEQLFKRKIQIWKYTAAASIALLIAFGSITVFKSKSTVISNIEVNAPFGIRSMITLPDGSLVYLNSGSTIKYPAIFSDTQRKVLLIGEAYFEVAKDTDHPFIVETGELNIKVLGTHFNIKNYDDDKIIETSLIEGAVEVINISNIIKSKIQLFPNQQAQFNKVSKELNKRTVIAKQTILWKDGKYYFNNETFTTVVAKLERSFNKKIIIKSEDLKNKIFLGMFDESKTIFQILDVMKEYSDFNYTVKKDSIIIE